MTEHLIYTDDRLTVTARPYAAGTPQAQWIANFVRRSPNGRKMLDQFEAALATLQQITNPDATKP